MILATHALTGAVIGKYTENIWLIIISAFALHYILDAFRHGEYLNRKSKMGEFWKVAIDMLIGFTLVILMAKFQNLSNTVLTNMLLGAFFSLLPDFFTLLYWKGGIKLLKPLFEFHIWVHRYPIFSPEREWALRNAVNDIIVSIIAIILLLI